MKTNRFKTLWGIALSFVLLTTALPFLVQAQSAAKTNGSQEITRAVNRQRKLSASYSLMVMVKTLQFPAIIPEIFGEGNIDKRHLPVIR